MQEGLGPLPSTLPSNPERRFHSLPSPPRSSPSDPVRETGAAHVRDPQDGGHRSPDGRECWQSHGGTPGASDGAQCAPVRRGTASAEAGCGVVLNVRIIVDSRGVQCQMPPATEGWVA
jgi:hypothetical protein